MTVEQWLSVAVLFGMMALFLWERFRYDVTAIIALLCAIALGLVKPDQAFTGFSDDIVIIVGSALVISAAVQRSGLIEDAVAYLSQRIRRVGSQLLLLTSCVGLASGLVKNVGALAMLMPAATQFARKSDTNPSVFLMPMSFASLLGGLMTLVGTSPNIIVSRVREEMTGQPFGMFDYLPTGLGLLIVGLLFLRLGYRLLPSDRQGTVSMGQALNLSSYETAARVPPINQSIGETLADFVARHDHDVDVTAIQRGGHSKEAHSEMVVEAGDVLVLTGEPDALERVIARDGLILTGQDKEQQDDDTGVVEGVIMAGSALVDRSAARMRLQDRLRLRLIAISREGEKLAKEPGQSILRAGDVIVLQGALDMMPERLRELGVLPIAERQIRLGTARRGWLAVIILAAAMTATATGLVPVAIAFFAAAGLILVTGALPVRDAYEAIEWPILIMLGALIPVSATLQSTGASDVIATQLSHLAATLPPWGAVMLILAAAMAVTPFLNNAATVLVMAPIAAVFASDLGYRPEAFLIATAIGAGCDFLTPIGHQCNTLVFGPGGYKFSDYARLGAPLSLLVLAVGTPLILWTWPL
ncbi:di/tricarboxylate transporter [Novosphingobium fluoreni]|uniref:Di/tricarboxylate transporter n=1 Tax=Novosphingobium fluoreni TaxID=1391222 RepID=A0A7W6BXD0_9SPHN|nr:SLC13 family permease [Novosphingobium fluoreni]MBB3939683.1 di/tricarboxylate transporter [Novosphingobium fluoreni]